MANATKATSSKSTTNSSSSGGSSSQSTSHSTGGGTTSNVGYSGGNSGSSGTSSSHTSSNSSSHTEGGSHTYSSGASWAAGKVDETTQAQFDKYNQDYAASDKVNAAYDALQSVLNQKPTFQSNYESKLNELYDKIMNREQFSYDFNKDNMYKLYKDQYTAAGKQAMQDTIGRANAMNGGYGSSYSQSAGQQTYQNYLQQLNNIIPELREAAYREYQDEGNQLNQKYGLTSDAYNREYGQYRDSVSDWQADRNFNQSAYQDERNFDYGQFNDNRGYWQNEYWNEKNAVRANEQTTDSSFWSDTKTKGSSDTTSKSDQTGWNTGWNTSQGQQTSWQDSNSNTDTKTWNNTSSTTNTTSSGSGSDSNMSTKQKEVHTEEYADQMIRSMQQDPDSAYKRLYQYLEKDLYSPDDLLYLWNTAFGTDYKSFDQVDPYKDTKQSKATAAYWGRPITTSGH